MPPEDRTRGLGDGASAPHAAGPAALAPLVPKPGLASRFGEAVRDYFLGEDPTLRRRSSSRSAFSSMLLFTRHPMKTNFIFDEQEALLANPYVRSVADPISEAPLARRLPPRLLGAPARPQHRLVPPDPRSRVARALGDRRARRRRRSSHHWVNVLFHGVNGALVALIVLRLHARPARRVARRARSSSRAAVLTEAVSGVVGIADVLGGTGALLALMALALPLPS